MDTTRKTLRLLLATIAYRGGKTLHGAPETMGEARVCESSWSAREILAHIAVILEWVRRMVDGDPSWRRTEAGGWDEEVERFYQGLQRLDDRLADEKPLECSVEKLLHGPLADILTHVGQLASIRRLVGAPLTAESYFAADIRIGEVGPNQRWPSSE